MRFVFRVDASLLIGTGHVVRCATLAQELCSHGHEIHFVCRAHDGHLGDWLLQKGFQVHMLLAPSVIEDNTVVNNDYLAWLGVSQQQDAIETIGYLKKVCPDWLIIDHYVLDVEWEETVKSYTHKILVIDDLANRDHITDLLLDQNLYLNLKYRYQHRVNRSCQQLLGPKYALLRPEFSFYRAQIKKRLDKPKILVFFGGIDLAGETVKFLKAIQHRFTNYYFEVVLGAHSPHFSSALALCEGQSHIHLWHGCNEMAKLMRECDFAFGASGSTNWERFCMGLDAAIVSIAENQEQLLQDLAAQNLVMNMGHSVDISVDYYQTLLANLNLKGQNHLERVKRITKICDGQGCNRVVAYLEEVNNG